MNNTSDSDPIKSKNDFLNFFFNNEIIKTRDGADIINITSDDTDEKNAILKITDWIKNNYSVGNEIGNEMIKEFIKKSNLFKKLNINCSSTNIKHLNIKCNKIYIALYILHKLIDFGFLIAQNDEIFFNDGKTQMSWNGLKKFKNDFIVTQESDDINQNLLYKMIIWYFRKIVVNSIIDDLIEYYKEKSEKEYNCENLKYLSVGSEKITSDYDITLSGANNKCTAIIIYKYQKIINKIFNKSSDYIFDTNLYGSDFFKKNINGTIDVLELNDESCDLINKISPLFKNIKTRDIKKFKCIPNSDQLNMLKKAMSQDSLNQKSNKTNLKSYSIDNLIEQTPSLKSSKKSLIGNSIPEIFSSTTSLLNLAQASSDITHVKTCDSINQRIWAYIKFISNYTTDSFNIEKIKNVTNDIDLWENAFAFIKNNPHDKDIDVEIYNTLIYKSEDIINCYGINNYTSLVNYHGNETYYTRSAFIDVVVNQQMMQKKEEKFIHLDNNDYINSFIENISDYILHDYKEKYLNRCIFAKDHLKNDNEFKQIFNDIINSTSAKNNKEKNYLNIFFHLNKK